MSETDDLIQEVKTRYGMAEQLLLQSCIELVKRHVAAGKDYMQSANYWNCLVGFAQAVELGLVQLDFTQKLEPLLTEMTVEEKGRFFVKLQAIQAGKIEDQVKALRALELEMLAAMQARVSLDEAAAVVEQRKRVVQKGRKYPERKTR